MFSVPQGKLLWLSLQADEGYKVQASLQGVGRSRERAKDQLASQHLILGDKERAGLLAPNAELLK